MDKRLVIPFIIWLLFMVVGVSGLMRGIQHQESWRIAAAAISLLISSGFLYVIYRHTAKQLKAVKVRK